MPKTPGPDREDFDRLRTAVDEREEELKDMLDEVNSCHEQVIPSPFA